MSHPRINSSRLMPPHVPLCVLLLSMVLNQCVFTNLLEEESDDIPAALALLAAGPGAPGGGGTSTGATGPEYFVVTSLIQSQPAGQAFLFRRRDGSCLLDQMQQITMGRDPYDLISDASGSFVYIANAGDSTITPFRMDYTTETMTALSNVSVNGPAANPIVYAMAIHPSGYLYSADGNSAGSIGMFQRDNTSGALTNLTPNDFIAGGNYMWYPVLERTGSYLYVSHFNGFMDAGNDSIYGYSVNSSTGALTQLPMTYPAQNQPWYLAQHPSRDFLYVSNYGSASVGMYSINTGTGALTAIGSGNVAASANPIGLAVGENFAFAAANGAGNVHGYSINASTGELTQVSQISGLSPTPYGLRLSRDGACLYVGQGDDNAGTTNDRLSIYSVDSAGTMTFVADMSAGIGPRFIESIRQR